MQVTLRGQFQTAKWGLFIRNIQYSYTHSKDSIENDYKTYLGTQKEILNDKYSYNNFLDFQEDRELDQMLLSMYADAMLDGDIKGSDDNATDYFDYLDYVGDSPDE